MSFVIEVSFVSNSAKLSAEIANAVVEAYITNQIETRNGTTEKATIWLQDRIRELGDQSTATDRAVAEFKTKNNIVQTNNGQLVNDQQVSELNTRLIDARAQTSAAEARLDRIDQVLRADGAGTVTDTLNSPIINQLRTKYLELSNREAEWSARLGTNHGAVVNVRRQINEIRNSIREELKRIAETYKSDFEIAKQRQEAIEKQLANAEGQAHSGGQARATLNELESKARTYHTLYDSLLQRYEESSRQGSLQTTQAQFVTRASPPLEKSSPKSRLILLGASCAGLLFGFGLGYLRNSLENSFRTTTQVVAALRTNCIAMIPLVPARSKPNRFRRKSRPKSTESRVMLHDASAYWTATRLPLSRFAESIRAIKLAVDLSLVDESKIIGVTSALPHEGKSTVSINIASTMAQVGARVILLDGDLRNPSLSRRLAPRAKLGIVDVILGKASLEDAVWTDPSTKLTFLPAMTPHYFQPSHSTELLASSLTGQFLERLRQSYDYVVFDLSPFVPVVDAHAALNFLDAHILVVEWGSTKIKAVERVLSEARNIRENLVGVVLNKVNMKKLHRYESHTIGEYYNNKYLSRYYEE